MKILVTGSEGLIGTQLCQRLKCLGIEEVHFDNKFPNTHLFYGDILHPHTLKSALGACDGIIHLAAVSRVIWGEKNPELCWQTNYGGTCAVIESALSSATKPWILYASRREVLGSPAVLPATETTPCTPLNIYGYSKKKAEEAILKAREQGLLTAVVRFSNVYGVLHDHHDRVIPAFCKAAAFGDSIRIEGSSHSFDFTHIDDVIEGILKIIFLLQHNKVYLPPLHLTTGKETTLGEVAALANKVGNKRSEILEFSPRNYDVPNFVGDSSKTQALLGWTPNVDIEEGITRLVKLFQQSYQKTGAME